MMFAMLLYTDRLSASLDKYNTNEIYVERNLGVVINIEGMTHASRPLMSVYKL